MGSFRTKLKRDVLELSLPKGRMVGSPGHDRAREYIVGRMAELSLAPFRGDSYQLGYTRAGRQFANLVGVVKCGGNSAKPVLIGAHYDSVIDAPCADDNASAVAIALAAAEVLAGKSLSRDVIIAIFDAEEQPHFQSSAMGSIRFHEDHLAENGIHAALIMDLMGHDVLVQLEDVKAIPYVGRFGMIFAKSGQQDVALPMIRDLLFITGAESHPALPGLLERTAHGRRLRPVAVKNDYIGDVSDHGVFRTNGSPYLFLSCGRWRHYHMPTDTPDKLNYAKMERMMRYLVALTGAISEAPLEGHESGAFDTADFEIGCLKRACGVLLPGLLKMLEVEKLQSRSDIDAVVHRLLAMGL
ncbi:MAG: M28 family peptidase [Phycisphaerales bacterium]|nr:MAG: M28 family peptidase [Phycisphaerales bacterium]